MKMKENDGMRMKSRRKGEKINALTHLMRVELDVPRSRPLMALAKNNKATSKFSPNIMLNNMETIPNVLNTRFMYSVPHWIVRNFFTVEINLIRNASSDAASSV